MKLLQRMVFWICILLLQLCMVKQVFANDDELSTKGSPSLRITALVLTTERRNGYHELIHNLIRFQTRKVHEIVVVDDPGKPSAYFGNRNDHGLVYLQTEKVLPIGAKRNFGIERSSGDIIVHFDDDDLYGPSFVETMVDVLVKDRLDLVKLGSWHYYDLLNDVFGLVDPFEHECNEWLWGYGFSFVYKRALWESVRFVDIMRHGEDYAFIKTSREIGHRVQVIPHPNEKFIVLHGINGNNTSKVFTTSIIPNKKLEGAFHGQCSHLECEQFFRDLESALAMKKPDFSSLKPFPPQEIQRRVCDPIWNDELHDEL